MNIILWIIFGAIAGWIASIIMGREESVAGMELAHADVAEDLFEPVSLEHTSATREV